MRNFHTWVLFLLTVSGLRAATVEVSFLPGNAEPAPEQMNSMVITGATSRQGIQVTLQGRNYAFPDEPGATFGITTGSYGGQPVFQLDQGLPPDRVGGIIFHEGKRDEAAASYLSVKFENVAAGTLFQGVTIDFSGLAFVRSSKGWAGTSADEFATSTRLNITGNTKGRPNELSVTLPDFTEIHGGTTEVRIYGMYGVDTGYFNSVQVMGNIVSPVPEPGALSLAGLGVLAMLMRRRR